MQNETGMHGAAETTDNATAARLKSFIQRVERLEEEKEGLAEDIKEVYAEARGLGFDTKTIKQIVRLRKKDAEKRREEDELLELYRSIVGV